MTNEELEKRLNKLESFMLSAQARLKLEDEINADLLAYIEKELEMIHPSGYMQRDLGERLARTLHKALLGRKL